MMQRESFIILLIFVPIISCIVGGRKAALPPYDDPVVFVKNCEKFSRVEGFFNPPSRLYTFRGIRYADPPVRENRFLRPKMRKLLGDVDARRNAPPCPQPDFYDENKIIGNEDCLALNIFTPMMPDDLVDDDQGLPVILWIHGGGYRYGSAAQYDAEPLIQDKVIFVPIQYRLGTLGILGDGSKEFSGNVAMFDMHAALQWVEKYIKYFGGDPKQIKVIGHGSGATSAMYLASSPMGRSSLSGVGAMSGSSLSQFTYDENATLTNKEIADVNDCPSENELELVKCLRSKSADEIIKSDSNLQISRLAEQNMIKAMTGLVSFAPNIEEIDDLRGLPGLITSKPKEQLQQNSFEFEKKIPLLIGVTRDETANGINTNEIMKIFKTGNEFLKATASALKLNDLLNTPQQVKEMFSSLGFPTLSDYMKIPDGINPEKILNKFIESTTDAFFNLPTVLTAGLWGKSSNAFFYQFDHLSESKSGRKFLKPLPLVSKGELKDKIAHGDDLGFLFNICDVYGNKINGTELKTPKDQKVRKNFVDLITKFAYLDDKTSEFSLQNFIVKPFKSDAANFIKISDKISFEKDFRFCELSLWGAPLKATQKITCDFPKSITSQISKVTNVVDKFGKIG